MLEPATLSEELVAPNRLALARAGSAIGLALGDAALWMRETRLAA